MDPRCKRGVVQFAQRQLGLITFRQVLEAGGTNHFVRARLGANDWVEVHRGLFKVGIAPLTDEQRLMAALLIAGPNAALSHFTAATLLGLSVPHSPHIHVTIPYERRGGRLNEDTKVHRAKGFGKHLTTLRLPYRVTTVGQTVIDCCAELDARWIGAMVDSAGLQRRAYVNSIITSFLAQPPERPGMGRLGEVLRRRVGMDVLPQSVLESMALELLQRLPVALTLQHPIVLPDGRTIHVDFAFPDHKLALEFDGYENHVDEWAFRNDRLRGVDSFIAGGWTTLRFTWSDVKDRPRHTLDKISDALARAEAIRPKQSSA